MIPDIDKVLELFRGKNLLTSTIFHEVLEKPNINSINMASPLEKYEN